MKYTVRKETSEVHAILFDGTLEGVHEIERFLIVHDQTNALATKIQLNNDKFCCQIGYIDLTNPMYLYLMEDEYFVLIPGEHPITVKKDTFERIYRKTY
ncbi:MAG: hypothetical protein NC489_08350 [Ruminococcus flavefaciens]|nr:hypothetical protein [Ruminococcus flavefaciens]